MKILLTILFLLITSTAYAHPIDLDAIALIESSNRADVCSYKGCKYGAGLYQISSITREHYNITHSRAEFTQEDLFNPIVNTIIADWYLDWCSRPCEDDVRCILVLYNWGYGNWMKWKKQGSDWNRLPKETRNYIKKYERIVNGNN